MFNVWEVTYFYCPHELISVLSSSIAGLSLSTCFTDSGRKLIAEMLSALTQIILTHLRCLLQGIPREAF